jgi:predicted adenylyl cyclase CyaB
MPRNVEIKARLTAPDAVRDAAAALADGPARVLRQHDTFYRTPSGRLKLRRCGEGRGELIAYARSDAAGPKTSRYVIAPTDDPDALHAALAAALDVRGEVVKVRRLYLRGRTRIHLDDVAGLGHFLELEVVLAAGEDEAAGRREAREVMARLGVGEDDLVACAYIDLLEQAP